MTAQELENDCKEIAKCAALHDFAMTLCGPTVRVSRKRIDGSAFVVVSINGEDGLFISAEIAKQWLVEWSLEQDRWVVLVVDQGGNAETYYHLSEMDAEKFRDRYQNANLNCHFAIGKASFSSRSPLINSTPLDY